MSGAVGTPGGARRRVTLERTYAEASVDEVWEMWTTKDGIESWWGPDGFEVKVRSIDLRPGGQMVYAMSAIAPPQIDFVTRAGMPTVTEHRLTYTELAAPRRLAYTHVVDFVPGTAPYHVSHLVELHVVDGGVRVVLAFDAMHDERWTQLAVMGWQMELGKLEAALAATT